MYPYRPIVIEGANCGPTVLAAILECHTSRAIAYLEKHNENGWGGYTNVGHIRNVLEARGRTFEEVDISCSQELDSMERKRLIACFIQIKGPWMGKGWRSEYTHTHWALLQFGHCLDVNNPMIHGDQPTWISISDWMRDTMPRIIASYEGGNGWELRSAYSVEVSL